MVSPLCVCVCVLFQTVEGDLRAYQGMVKNLGKEAKKLAAVDPDGAKEIAAKQVWMDPVIHNLFKLTLKYT